MASSALTWMMLKNNNSFILKRAGKSYTTEPNNLKGKNCFKYSGLVHDKTIGIETDKASKSIVIVTKKGKSRGRPAKTYARTTCTRGGRRTLAAIRKTIRNNKYRKDLEKLALRRASALMKSHKPVVSEPTKK